MDDNFIDNIFNGFVDAYMGDELSKALEEAKVNQHRKSITDISFAPVPTERTETLRSVKTGFFGGGTKKKLIDSFENGRTTYAEVLVLARCLRVTDRDDDDPGNNSYNYFYKVADLEGNVIREDVPALENEYAIGFSCNKGDSASETGSPDKVDPSNYLHMYVLHYYLKDDQYYVALTKEEFEDLTLFVKFAGSRHHFVEDGVGYSW